MPKKKGAKSPNATKTMQRVPRTGANKEANRAKRQAGMGANKAVNREKRASKMGTKKTRGY